MLFLIDLVWPRLQLWFQFKTTQNTYQSILSVAEWSKAQESDASAGGESPVRAPVRAATLCPYA